MVLLALLVLLQVGEAPGGEGQPSISIDAKPMQIDGRLPELAFIATTADPIPADLVGIEMLESRTGLIAALEPKAFVSINRLARPADASELDFNSAAMLYLQIQRDQNWHVLAIRAIDDGSLSMVQTDNPQRCWTIRREAFDRLGIPLAASATPEQLGPDREAQTLVLATPHVESEIVLDTRTIRAKIRMTYPRLSRTLGEETIRVRLPKGFDPSTPAGVLVWISPNEDGRIPTIFEPECDELGLIAIGVDNNGNQRQITDRLQNHLDSIETLATRAGSIGSGSTSPACPAADAAAGSSNSPSPSSSPGRCPSLGSTAITTHPPERSANTGPDAWASPAASRCGPSRTDASARSPAPLM